MVWKNLQDNLNTVLEQAQKEAHRAVQLAGVTARSLLPYDKSDSIANLGWNASEGVLIGHEIATYQTGIRLKDLTLLLFREEQILFSVEMAGKNFIDTFEWLKQKLTEAGLEGNKLSWELPYELPEYASAKEKKFDLAQPIGFEELANYFHNANFLLQELVDATPEASSLRCWPHHFDLGSLIVLEAGKDPETAKSVGFGFSPGDHHYTTPYFYINPYPTPDADVNTDFPLTSQGHWHTEGWKGIILTADKFVGEHGENIVRDYLKEGITIAHKTLNL